MSQKDPELCSCGRPLHYSDPSLREIVKRFSQALGATIPIQLEGKTYLVPRHYIALHGIKAYDLPALAKQFKWKVLL